MSERKTIQRKKPAEHMRSHQSPGSLVTSTIPAGGQQLDSATRAAMEPRFGHDFANVRIFTDSAAAEQAQDLDAKAYTVGSDIFFNQHFYDPYHHAGQHLLAHELTHVVQHERHGAAEARPNSASVSHPADAAEREAATVADQVVAGNAVQVVAAPSGIASRGLLDWVEEKAADVGDMASGAWNSTKSVASDIGDVASSAWDSTKSVASDVGDVASSAWDGTKSVASDIYGGMKTASGWVKKGEEAVNHGIDWVEDKEKAGTHWLASKAEGIPVLEQIANAGASAVDFQTELTGGMLRGATGLVGGIAGMVVNPVDTAKGLEAMAEHIPMMPGVPNPLKAAHGLLNVATGDESWGQFANSTFNPLESAKQDGEFWKNVGGGLIGQYSEQWKQGKYADVVGHAGFDIGSLFLGAGEANAAGKLGEASKLADAARLGEAADLAKAGEVADLAKAGEVADAAKAVEAVDAAKATEASTATRETGALDEAVDGARGAGEPPSFEPPSGGGEGGGSAPFDNSAHNASDFERLKAKLSQEEIMGAEPKGSALKGGSGDVRSTQVMEPKEIIVDGKPKIVNKRVDGVREVKMGVDADHSAPIFEQSRIAEEGRVFPMEDGKNLTQMSSGVNGREGIVEYIVDKEGNLVHQQFIEGGGVNGVPGGKPNIRPNNGSYYPEPDLVISDTKTAAATEGRAAVAPEPPASSAVPGEPVPTGGGEPPIKEPPSGGGGGSGGSGGGSTPEPLDNSAHNAADYQRLKEELAAQQGDFHRNPSHQIRNGPESVYIPDEPLATQRVDNLDMPLPDPAAEGRPHTVLGGRTGSTDGVRYRQSATFNGESWPKANGQVPEGYPISPNGYDVPEGRVDWHDHSLPQHHDDPHIHEYSIDVDKKNRAKTIWREGGQRPWWPWWLF